MKNILLGRYLALLAGLCLAAGAIFPAASPGQASPTQGIPWPEARAALPPAADQLAGGEGPRDPCAGSDIHRYRDIAATLAAAFEDRRPLIHRPPIRTLDEGYCIQRALLTRLALLMGPPQDAFKAALTTKATQARFHATTPIRGELFRRRFLEDGATVPADFGARPLFEADLLVSLRHHGLERSSTIEMAIRHVDSIIPFIELPDLLVAPSVPLDPPLIAAINAGARLGVTGTPRQVTLETADAFLDGLANMTVTVLDQDGTLLDQVNTAELDTHPLDPALWLAHSLGESKRFTRMDTLLSLGSLTTPRPPKAGEKLTVRYEGLPGGPMEVSVTFR